MLSTEHLQLQLQKGITVLVHAAAPDVIGQIAEAIMDGRITVPIATSFPIEQIREAGALQAERHTHGKMIIRP